MFHVLIYSDLYSELDALFRIFHIPLSSFKRFELKFKHFLISVYLELRNYFQNGITI